MGVTSPKVKLEPSAPSPQWMGNPAAADPTVAWMDAAGHHYRNSSYIDTSFSARSVNTLLVTAEALYLAGTTLEQFQDWISQWWKLAVEPHSAGLPHPQDEGEIVSPTQID